MAEPLHQVGRGYDFGTCLNAPRSDYLWNRLSN